MQRNFTVAICREISAPVEGALNICVSLRQAQFSDTCRVGTLSHFCEVERFCCHYALGLIEPSSHTQCCACGGRNCPERRLIWRGKGKAVNCAKIQKELAHGGSHVSFIGAFCLLLMAHSWGMSPIALEFLFVSLAHADTPQASS